MCARIFKTKGGASEVFVAKGAQLDVAPQILDGRAAGDDRALELLGRAAARAARLAAVTARRLGSSADPTQGVAVPRSLSSSPRLSAVCLAVLCIAGALAATVSAAITTGADLRRSLPGPESRTSLKGTTEFTGLDSTGAVAIAVVRSRSGAVVAYVCDGRRVSRWLTGRVRGGRATLRGRAGARLTARFSGRRVTGTARVGRRSLRFVLTRASKGIGLRRLVARRDSDRAVVEAAWITTRAGRIIGIGSTSGAVVFRTTVDNAQQSGADTTGELEPGTGGAGGAEAEPLLFDRAQCAVLLLRITSKLAQDDPNATLEAIDLAGRFGDKNCSRFFRLPSIEP
jgi:hypothetical protein